MNTWDSLSRQIKDKVTGEVISNDTRPVRDVYAQAMMAPQYADLTFPVPSGQHCIYEGILYVAAQGIQTSEVWTAAHWTEVKLGAELANLKSQVTSIDGQLMSGLKKTYNVFDKYDYVTANLYIYSSARALASNNQSRCVILPAHTTGKTILFKTKGITSRILQGMKYCTTDVYPSAGVIPLQYWTSGGSATLIDPINIKGQFTPTIDANYVMIEFNFASTLTQSEIDDLFATIVDGLMVVYTDETGINSHWYDDYAYINAYILDVEYENLSEEIKGMIDASVPDAEYVNTVDLHLGNSVLGAATLGTNWTVDNDVYTHASGSDSQLQFATTVSANSAYILRMTTSYTSGECVKVSIDGTYYTVTYNGSADIVLALKPTTANSTLYLMPYSSTNFSLSNISLCAVQDDGEAFTMTLRSCYFPSSVENYGRWNTLLGYAAGGKAIGSTRLVGIGANAMANLLVGNRNVAIGTYSMSGVNEGEGNIAIGSDAMLSVVNGSFNSVIGYGAASYGKGIESNVAIGRYAMQNAGKPNVAPKQNVIVGDSAGIKTESIGNVMVGYNAGYRNVTGKYQTIVGSSALGFNGGDGNTMVGALIYSSNPIADAIGLGKSAIPTRSNQMMLGSTAITEVVMCGNKKIVFNADGTVTWETLQ